MLSDLTEATEKLLLGNIPLVTRSDTSAVVDWSKMTHIDSGLEGDVYMTRKGNSVLKVARLTHGIDEIQRESYLNFVSVCLSNQNNPFFPKINKAVVYKIPVDASKSCDRATAPKNKSGSDYVLVVSMERLISLKKVSAKVKAQAFAHLGLAADDSFKARWDSKYVPIDDIGDTNEAADLAHTTTNVNFKNALNKLEPLFTQFGSDTHEGNWMIRKTGSGAQVVLLDPISPSY